MADEIETIHVYIVREDEARPEEDKQAVESSLTQATSSSYPLAHDYSPSIGLLTPSIILAVNVLLFLAVFFIHVYPILTATATITIIPKSYHLTEYLTLSHVQSRVFQPLTLTESKTVPATGKGHQDATLATGTIILYNASLQPQTIDAGTLFIGSDGVHIVTDQAALIPGANPPTEGQATIPAHAVNAGRAGNIKAGDIQGACCRENIFAYNSMFNGGLDERDYPMVIQRDITTVVSSLIPMLRERIQTAFQQQIHPGELLTPNQCSQKTVTDRTVGDEAATVTVTVSESCMAGAYNTQIYTSQVIKALSQKGGEGYLLTAYFPTSSLQAYVARGRLILSESYQATLIYHFTNQKLQELRRALAGKTKQQAIQTLSHLEGVENITLKLSGSENHLPTDGGNIQLVIANIPTSVS